MSAKKYPTSIQFTEAELQLTEELRAAAGVRRMSDLIRLALREAAEARGLVPPLPEPRRIRRPDLRKAA